VHVHRNDAITLGEVAAWEPEAIVISPGPCTPNEAGICVPLIQRFAGKIPILGVCLGHQAIGQAFGGRIGPCAARDARQGLARHARRPRRVSAVLPTPLSVTRYHSLAIEPATMPACLEVTATADDGEVMGVRHREFAVEGVQFHPKRSSPSTARAAQRISWTARSTDPEARDAITPQEALQRTIEHREIFGDEMLSIMRRIMSGE
jgi:anthranilate synthase component 2